MKCPHCSVEILPNFKESYLGKDNFSYWSVFVMICPNPECGKIIIDVACSERSGIFEKEAGSVDLVPVGETDRKTVYPVTTTRNFQKQRIDDRFCKNYEEAWKTLAVSPKASAAPSWRCLQNILREKAT